LQLAALVGIFIALPVILYGQFERADRQSHDLVAAALRRQGWLAAQALAPALDRPAGLSTPTLDSALARLARNGTILRLMFRPRARGAEPARDFYFIASAPPVPPDQTGPDIAVLTRHGILPALRHSCVWDKPVEIRYRRAGGVEEILTSVVPIKNRRGCWVLVSAGDGRALMNTGVGRPYWQTGPVRMATLIYLVFAILAALVVLRVRRALRHFHSVACGIRRGGAGAASFASRAIAPELAAAAADFDGLVEDLHRAASDIRRTAEENAHSVKTPLATIRSALHPIRRMIPAGDEKAARAFLVIDTALARLFALISTAQRVGNETADFIEAPKLNVDLGRVVSDALRNARDISAESNIRFIRRLDEGAHVLAPDGVLDIIVDNILDNAIGFSRPGGVIVTTLTKFADTVAMTIEDEGPGVEDGKLDRIFDRNVSFRPAGTACHDEPDHAGLGLWIVRRYAEALGGAAHATNRKEGGLCLHVTLPRGGR
jgi:two-component system sensor histidine kinase ChvG